MSVRNELSDFEIEEFFGSLQELLVSSINNEYLSFDSAEFMSRRFDGYDRTLNEYVKDTRISSVRRTTDFRLTHPSITAPLRLYE